MSLTILLVVVVLFSFIVGRILTAYASRFVTLSGAEYILVGALIGPQIPPRLLSAAALDRLSPLVSLLLGLLGFVLGLRARRSSARFGDVVVGLLSALGVMVVVGAAVLCLASQILPTPPDAIVFQRDLWRYRGWVVEIHSTVRQGWLAIALGASACVVASSVIESTSKRMAASGRALDLLQTIAATSQIAAVTVLGLALAVARATESASRLRMGIAPWALAAIGAGVACGLLFTLFIGREADPKRIFLASVGAVIFASGIGSALDISPLFTNLVAGATVAVTSRHATALRDELDRLQHPIYVLVMILAGAHWAPVRGWVWVFPFAYVACRFVARSVLSAILVRVLLGSSVRVPRIGQALLAQGTLGVAIGLNFALVFPSYAPVALTTVLLGALLSDLRSERALRSVLLDSGVLEATAVVEDGDRVSASATARGAELSEAGS